MSDENEVQQGNEGGDTYHEYDNSVHHAVNLWPLVLIAIVAAALIALLVFLPDAKHREQSVPNGKAYTATDNSIRKWSVP